MAPVERTTRDSPGHSVWMAVALLAAAIVAGGVIAFRTWQQASIRPTTTRVAPTATSPRADAVAAARRTTAAARSPAAPTTASSDPLPEWPASLRDSAPDGAVTLDDQGQVQPSRELRRLFDYFLTALGEADLDAIRHWLIGYVERQHGSRIANDVAVQFDRYVRCEQALAQLGAASGESAQERLARVISTRRQWLDAASADAYYGDDERYAAYTLDRRDVLADTGIDAATRAARLRELDARLSPEQRRSMAEATTAQWVDEQNRQFDALHIDPAQRQAEREALFGRDAADRLAAVDAEIAAWDARVAAYVRARDALSRQPFASAAARAQAIDALRARHFDETEQRRVRSLEAIGAH